MSVEDVLADIKTKWAAQASDATKADTDAAMEAIRASGDRREGQSLEDDRIAQEMGKRRLHEATLFAAEMNEWFGGEVREHALTRWQGYFAASLLAINLRAGCPPEKGGADEFDRTAAGATKWWTAKNTDPIDKPEAFTAEIGVMDIEKGAALAQRLLDYFNEEVLVRGLDRWQGHFSAALLTVELRSGCPGADGGTDLFDNAVDAAWKYFDTMSAK